MGRAPFNVLIIPYRRSNESLLEFAVTKRADGDDIWQFLSGEGEDEETPVQAAQREANEEGGIPYAFELVKLDTIASVRSDCFTDQFGPIDWGRDLYVVTEYSFAVDMKDRELILSVEHTEVRWLGFDDAAALLTYDSNRNAMWEVTERLKRGSLPT